MSQYIIKYNNLYFSGKIEDTLLFDINPDKKVLLSQESALVIAEKVYRLANKKREDYQGDNKAIQAIFLAQKERPSFNISIEKL